MKDWRSIIIKISTSVIQLLRHQAIRLPSDVTASIPSLSSPHPLYPHPHQYLDQSLSSVLQERNDLWNPGCVLLRNDARQPQQHQLYFMYIPPLAMDTKPARSMRAFSSGVRSAADPSAANGNQTAPSTNLYVNFLNLPTFDSFTMTSTSYAFEVDNIAVGTVPVPEPASLLLLGLGLVGLAGVKRKFKK